MCKEGYVGIGNDCHAPPEFRPHQVVHQQAGDAMTSARDVNTAVFGSGLVGLVFRDAARGNIGRVLIGKVHESGAVDLAEPEQFTEGNEPAFDPMIAGTTNNRFLIGWRDAHREGTGWARGAAVAGVEIPSDGISMNWGGFTSLATGMSQKMALLDVADDNVALLYTDRIPASRNSLPGYFGNAFLTFVDETGNVNGLGRYRFSDAPVSRLDAVRITPRTFVIAARAMPAVDDFDGGSTVHQEALAIHGEKYQDGLIFSTNTLNLEPNRTQIWSRGVSLVAPDTFAYSYLTGMTDSPKVMQAVVKVEPDTHQMQVIAGPNVIHSGFTPYVSMLSVPYTATEPHTATFFRNERTNASEVMFCRWNQAMVQDCEHSPWMNEVIPSSSGAHLGGGRAFMFYTTDAGVPLYTIFGVGKK